MPQLPRDIVVIDTKYIIPAIHIVVTIIFGYIVLRLIDSALSRLRFVIPQSEALGVTPRTEQRAETLRVVLRSVMKGILILLVLIQIGWELNYSFYPLLASAGIVGLAIGFGAQSLVKDVISGFFILFEDQFGVGDVVKIGEFSGVVERMTLRATVLRNLEGQVYVVPNGNIQHVTVMTKEWARAVLDITVRHEQPLGKTFDALQRVATSLKQDMPDRVLEQPTILGVEKLDDSGIMIRSIVKTPPFKNADVLREWRRRIIEEFDRNGILLTQKSEGTAGRPS
jgi:small conductance mechanosensitive channel